MTTPLYGNFAIRWADSDHKGTEREHLTRMPPQRILPAPRVDAAVGESEDLTVRETVVIAEADEVSFLLRGERNRRSLMDMARAALRGAQMTVIDLAQPDRSLACYLVNGDKVLKVVFDPDTKFREFQVELKFRAADASDLPDWFLYGTDGLHGLLFKYVPGMDLSGATFSRAAGANYDNVLAVTTVAATNVARDGHYQLVSGLFTRTLRIDSTANDTLAFPWPHLPQAMSVYVKMVERGTAAVFNERVVVIGATPNGQISIHGMGATETYRMEVDSASTTSVTLPSSLVSAGDAVELLGTLSADGEFTLRASINGGAVQESGTTTLALPAAWTNEFIYVGSNSGGAHHGDADYVSVKIAAGVHSMDKMRSL